jgi:hypothetical protein
MPAQWSQTYTRLDRFPALGEGLDCWHSAPVSDPAWDDFLRSTPQGQFQQSSLWAEYKALEGWSHYRVIVTDAVGMVGGFQILWKKSRLGRIGYVSKGPVVHPESSHLVEVTGRLLHAASKTLGLTGVIVQQPDEAQNFLSADPLSGFVTSNPKAVVEATYLVDVRDNLERVRSRMSASLRRNVRKAHKQKATIRIGTAADLPLFFKLMSSICRRQNTAPNPGSLEAVRHLWTVFAPTNSIRVTIAECAGQSPAAKLSLIFGDLVTVWKKGWDGTHGDWHPNELLEDEFLEWAHVQGYRACDFGSFNRSHASRILAGEMLGPTDLNSRDYYHFRFGGQPKLLPRSVVLFPNPCLRWCYQTIYSPLAALRSRQQSTAES